MKNAKKEKALRLFLAIGEVDEDLLQDALRWRPARRSVAKRIWLLAATLSLVSVILVGTVLVMLRTPAPLPPFPDSPDNPSHPIDLEILLQNERHESDYVSLEDETEIPFGNGESYLVWQYEDSETLCMSRGLTEDETKLLTREIGKGSEVGKDSPTLSCHVWIVLADGSVLSPYLKQTDGNIGAATLFDYEAELIPSQELSSCISDILN